MTMLEQDLAALGLNVPPAREHGRLLGRKSMQAEITELRRFIDDVLLQALPIEHTELAKLHDDLVAKHQEIAERHDREKRQLAKTTREHERLQGEVVQMRDEAILQEVGVYDYQHPMETADEYKEALAQLRKEYKALARTGAAVSATTTTWTVNESESEGRKMVRDTSKLLLRAYNNEADTLVDKLRPFRLEAATTKLNKSREAINKLGAQPMEIAITYEYHQLRLQELKLAADWLAKKEEEKEIAKAERARLREEAKARKEIDNERKRLAKERAHYLALVNKLREDGNETEAAKQEHVLKEIDDSFATVEERAANTRAGHVYVISNVGALGDQVVKIGMTRRLDPLDRVKELGDASVPFGYDIHALVFSKDAVALEQDLHDRFNDRRVNLVNRRREFFYVGPSEARTAIEEHESAVLTEFIENPEAAEWRMSENARKAVSS